MASSFTDQFLRGLKPRDVQFEVGDDVVAGLRLSVRPSGTKTWVFRYRFGGRPCKLTIGSFDKFELTKARKAARDFLDDLGAKKNPAQRIEEAKERERAKAEVPDDMFKTVYDDYEQRHVNAKRSSTQRELKRIFKKRLLPKFGDKRLAAITKGEVIDLLEDVADGGAPVGANRVLAVLRHFLNYCVTRDKLKISPIMGLKPMTDEVSRDRVLTADEIRWLWRAATVEGEPFGNVTKLLLTTAARLGEVAGMSDTEIDMDATLWTLPAGRVKNKIAHKIHLTPLSLGVLKSQRRVKNKARYVFCTNGKTPVSGFSRAKERLDDLMLKFAKEEAAARGENPDDVTISGWRMHDIRRTVATNFQALGVAVPVAEKCLNHISGSLSGVTGIYQRFEYDDEKREAFEAWSARLTQIVNAKPTKAAPPAKVLPMRRRAK